MAEICRRILVADDSEADVYMLEHALAAAGLECTIVQVADGEQVLARLEQSIDGGEGFELILLDWHLPKRQGGEILPEIQRLDGAPQCIVLTSTMPSNAVKELSGRGVTVWMKPDDLDGYLKLGETLKNLLGPDLPRSAAAR